MRHRRYVAGFGSCLLIVMGAWYLISGPSPRVHAVGAAQADAGGSGILDGMTFTGQILRDGKPVVDVVDKWVFANGTFLSTECAVRCNYPRAPYYIRRQGDAIEFVSESHCVDKDAKIVWRGTISGSEVKGIKVWTISRWYWTLEKEFDFEGTMVEDSASVAVN